jgi:AcrR family transcriptional regulator
MELFAERGFEETTTAEIAKRAGLTERTFFRHFADKREVLFYGQDLLQDLIVEAVASTPGSATPIDAVAAGIRAVGDALEENRAHARRRSAIIAANADLRERELIKLARIATAVTGVLRQRGVPDLAAGLAAEAGVAVFRIAFERWVEETNERPLADLVQDAFDELKTITAGR